MGWQKCSVCKELLGGDRQNDEVKAPPLCSEKCLAEAVERYWAKLGLQAVGQFVNTGGLGLRYRLLKVMRPIRAKPSLAYPCVALCSPARQTDAKRSNAIVAEPRGRDA